MTSKELVDRLNDLRAQLVDARTVLRRIESDLEMVRKIVVSHGERLAHIERDWIASPPANGGSRG